MIEISALHKTYAGGFQALTDINLSIEPGEFVVLLGPSGAGKSSLLRCINGLVPFTSGSLRVGGVAVGPKTLRAVRRQAGMVFQQFNLVKRLTVLENVLCGRLAYNSWLSALRLFPGSDIELALGALERVGLKEKADERCDRLSGGQQQRVGIARALVQRPAVILADEPVASLDPISARVVLDLLTEINARDGVTVVVSLHDIELARTYGRRIVGLHRGALVLDRPGSELTEADVRQVYGHGGTERDFAAAAGE